MRQVEDNELFSFHLWVYVDDGQKNHGIQCEEGNGRIPDDVAIWGNGFVDVSSRVVKPTKLFPRLWK